MKTKLKPFDIAVLFIGVLLLSYIGNRVFSDADFAACYHKDIDLNVEINNDDLYRIDRIEEELYKTVCCYGKDMDLCYARYVFDKNKTMAKFYYLKETGKETCKTVTLVLDVSEKKLKKAYVTSGDVRKVGIEYSSVLENNKDINIYNEYRKYLNEIGHSDDENPTITVTVTANEIYSYDTCGYSFPI